MRVFAYCAESFRRSVERAAGVSPLTCPPTSADTLDVSLLEGNGLLYFDLHGSPGIGHWRGDDWSIALTAQQIGQVDLGGATVFALSCFLGDADSPMMDALLDSGAKYVVGGDGQNWAGKSALGVYGASLLGLWFRRLLVVGFGAPKALALAKRPVAMQLQRMKLLGRKGRSASEKTLAAKDTLAFRMYGRVQDDESG